MAQAEVEGLGVGGPGERGHFLEQGWRDQDSFVDLGTVGLVACR